jgi:hypothetical protein
VALSIERFDSLAIQENVSGAHSTEGSVGLIAALDALEKSNIISSPCRQQRGDSSVSHIVAQSQYLLCRLRFYNPIKFYNFFGA